MLPPPFLLVRINVMIAVITISMITTSIAAVSEEDYDHHQQDERKKRSKGNKYKFFATNSERYRKR